MPSVPKLQLAFKKIAKLAGKDRIDQFNALKSQTPANQFATVLNQEMMHAKSPDGKTQIYGTYLAYAIMLGGKEDLFNFVRQLIESGAEITGRHLVTKSDSITEELSLIHICARMGEFELFKYLNTEHDLQITTLTAQGKSILNLLPLEKNVWTAFIPYLKEKGVLKKLCSIDHDNQNNIFNSLLKTSQGVVIAFLLYQAAPEAYQTCIIDYPIIRTLASATLLSPMLYPLLENNASLSKASKAVYTTTKATYHKQRDHFIKGGAQLQVSHVLDKAIAPAMKFALDDFINFILRNRRNLTFLLAKIEHKLKEALTLDGIQHRLDNASTEYNYRYIGLYKYPIPNEQYESVCKQSNLERVLIEILQRADMGKHARKWFGFIPPEKANQMIAEGDFFIESQFGIGVLHGKFSHMIQWALLILGIEDGYIRTQPGITAKSIIKFLVTNHEPHEKTNLFAFMIDVQYTEIFTFQDPYRLTSLITTGHFHEHCPTLEAYLRDAFCSGYLQWVAAFNKASPIQLSPDGFSVLLSHSGINEFIPTDYNKKACVDRVSSTINKNNTHKIGFFASFENPWSPYALIEKNYYSKKKYQP